MTAPVVTPEGKQTVTLPERQALVAGTADVLVIGGGPAGIGAAAGAADAGAQCILAERYGFLGGNATAALVMPLMSYFTSTPASAAQQAPAQHKQQANAHVEALIMPTDHGPGEPALAGVLQRFLNKLIADGGALPASAKTGYTVPFDPEIFKMTALELLEEAGVKLLFHAFASGILHHDGRWAVVFETKSGPIVIAADIIVDCSGDGDIAASAGAQYEIGREEDLLVQPMTLMFRMANIDQEEFGRYIREHPDQWRGVHGLQHLVQQAVKAGELSLQREDILFFSTPHHGEVAVNSTRVTEVLGTSVWDLSYAEWESRRQMKSIAAFLRKYVPGFADSYVAQSGTTVGVRETRRILGDYYITADDLLSCRRFPDVVARGTYPLDIHNPRGQGTKLVRLPPGQFYELPLRALLPKGLERIITAGRCISGSHEAHSAYRVMPISMATGQAAGVCAALACRQARSPRHVSFEDVQRELVNQGALL